MRGLVEGVLEDERERRSLSQAAEESLPSEGGLEIKTSCGAGVATRGVLPSYTYSNWTEQLFCLTSWVSRPVGLNPFVSPF